MMKIKQCIIFILINLNILGLLCACGSKEDNKNRVEFRYAASSSDYNGSLYYTDDYFMEDATYYNPSLATTSLGLAMSAFMSLDTDNPSDYSHRYINCENLLLNMGFKNVYANEYYKKKPETDSLGVVIASKKIDDYTLIAIGIRGAGYQQEWASNCKIGDGITEVLHEGFNDGATIMLDSLKYYINQNAITGKLKLWSAGFSRASAVNNLAIGRLDRSLYLNEPILPDTVSIAKEDMYAYCFEVPMGASFNEDISPRSEIYNNIFNIVNVYDPVPMVPMEGLGFTRYGIDCYLPNPLNDINYESDLNTIKGYYNSLEASSAIGEYCIDKFVYYGGLGEKKTNYSGDEDTVNFHGGLFVKDLLNRMIEEGITDRVAFKENIQDGLREVFTMIFKNDTMSESLYPFVGSFIISILINGNIDYLIDEIMHNPDNFVNDIMPIIKMAVETSTLLDGVSPLEFCNQIKGFITVLTKVFNRHLYTLFPFVSLNNLKALAQAHQPITCMANLMSMDPNYNKKPIKCDMSGGYYYVEIPHESDSGYINISMDGKDIARMESGGAINLSMYTYGRLDNKFIAYLPLGHSYSILSSIGGCNVYKYDQKYPSMSLVSCSRIDDPYTDEYTLTF